MSQFLPKFLKALGAFLRFAIYTFSIVFVCAALWLVDAIQKPPKEASRSSANPAWKAAVVFTGFRNPTYELRTFHDRFFLMRSPVDVGNLGTLGDWDFEPASVFWSKDGTLVLAKTRHRDGSVFYQCGYDFSRKRTLDRPDGTLRGDPAFEVKMERLLHERGGVGESIKIRKW